MTRARKMLRVGLVLVLAPIMLRATVGFESLPYWGTDPTVAFTPMTMLGPAASRLCDWAMVIGSLLLFLSGWQRRGHRLVLVFGLLTLGALAVTTWGDERGGWVQAGAWASAMFASAALMAVGRHHVCRVVAGACLLGCLVPWLGKGVVQLLIEHPMVVSDFRANKEAILTANGWAPGSPNALAFERRLMQAEATGWFGLSNVYASVCAGCAAFGAALLTTGRTPKVGGVLWGALGLVVCGGAGVWMSGSKGGAAALALGAGLAFVVWLLRRWPGLSKFSGWIGPALIAGVLGAVVVRGLIGERIGELSVLFRWYYLVGAARAWADSPWTGTTIAGFRDAYMLHKPALSPEDVTSPHSVLFDFVATLGVLGLAWAAAVVLMARWSGRALGERVPTKRELKEIPSAESEAKFVVFVAAGLAVVGASLVERAMLTPEIALLRVVSLVAWVGLVGVLSRPGVAWGPAFGAAGLTLVAHAQIEVSAVWVNSAGWVLGMIGLGAAVPNVRLRRRVFFERWPIDFVVICFVLGLLGAGVFHRSGQGELKDAALSVREPVEWRRRLEAAAAGRPLELGDRPETVARLYREQTGRSLPQDTASAMLEDLGRWSVERWSEAAEVLKDVSSPRLFEVWRAEGDLRVRVALTDPTRKNDLLKLMAEREQEVEREWRSAAAWGWLAAVSEAGARAFPAGSPERGELVERARRALARAAALDPHGLTFPRRAFALEMWAGDREAAAGWARRCLELSPLMRLDPLRDLNETERAAMERAAGGGS